jgi:hypothetical protein
MPLLRGRADTRRVSATAQHPPKPGRARARLALLWRVWRRRDELDRLLAAGARPDSSAELECRALQLTTANSRHGLAGELESVVAAVEEPATSRLAPDLRVDEVRDASDELLELAQRLYRPDPCDSRGAALCRRLLRDPLSPLYEPAPDDALRRAVATARRALDLPPPPDRGSGSAVEPRAGERRGG